MKHTETLVEPMQLETPEHLDGTACLNCESPALGEYCHKCGQKTSTHRFSVSHVLHEVPHSLFHLDKGIFHNIRSVVFPRRAVREYLSGRRVSYFNPLLFFFLTLGVILFLAPKMGIDTTLVVNVQNWETKGYDQGRWVNGFAKFLYVGCAFLLAIPNYYLFRKETGYNYAEHVVASFFILGYVNLVSLLTMPMHIVEAEPINTVSGVALAVFIFLTFQEGKWWLTLLKSVVAVFFCLALFLLTLTGIGFIGYSFLKFLN